MKGVATGLEVLLEERVELLRGARVGLVCHAASVDSRLRWAPRLFHGHPQIELAALFGPQHGLFGETQDNMIEWEGGFEYPRYGCPVHSLYGETRIPRPEWLEGLDVVVVDLQDVGTRIYTYVATLRNCMEAAGAAGVRVIATDRPNPLGGVAVEGPPLLEELVSFVGPSPGVVVRHGMTIGEMARWFRDRDGVDVDLEVVACRGWSREMAFDDTGLPWVLPSPNMPTLETAWIFPGIVVLEGTTASEGRGTTRPFEIFGHPGLDSEELAAALEEEALPGARFRPHSFQPTFQKHAGTSCGGVQLHVLDRGAFRPVRAGYAVTRILFERVGEPFWTPPPYEYVKDRMPVDVITGSGAWREAVEAGVEVEELAASWAGAEADFLEERRPHLLY